jgi:hypothetical protein
VLGPNLGRLTVGVDLGDKWSNDSILELGGETLAEGQLRTTQEDVTEFDKDEKQGTHRAVIVAPRWR